MASIKPRKDRDGNLIGYQAMIRRAGHKAQIKTFRRRRDAEVWAATVEGEIGRGVFVDRSESESTPLADLLDRYGKEITPQKRGATAERHKITVLREHPLAEMRVARIGGKDVARYRDDRLRVVQPATVNRELNLLSHVFSIAEKEWGLHFPNGNPVRLIQRPRGDQKRDRRLSPDEEAQLLEAARRVEGEPGAIRIADMIVIAIETCMRRGELVAMRWRDVDLDGWTIHIPRTKTDQPRSVPLSLRAVDTLKAMPRQINGTVWGAVHESSVSRCFAKAARRAGMEDIRFHDLRHEGVSRLFEDTDLDVMEIKATSGHKTLAMLNRYTHLRADRLVERRNQRR